MSHRPSAPRRPRLVVLATGLVMLALALVACGGSDDADRSTSASPSDRQAGMITDNIGMTLQNYSSNEVWIDFPGYGSGNTKGWDTPNAQRWARNEAKYFTEFPFRIILENNGGVKKYVEVNADNPLVASPWVKVAGTVKAFGVGTEHTFSGDGWSLVVKRLEDGEGYKDFRAEFDRN